MLLMKGMMVTRDLAGGLCPAARAFLVNEAPKTPRPPRARKPVNQETRKRRKPGNPDTVTNKPRFKLTLLQRVSK